MITVAKNRVKNEGWNNVTLCENTVEEIETSEKYDGALLFAMHDVFNSMEGVKRIYSLLKVDSRIVCVGPKTQDKGLM